MREQISDMDSFEMVLKEEMVAMRGAFQEQLAALRVSHEMLGLSPRGPRTGSLAVSQRLAKQHLLNRPYTGWPVLIQQAGGLVEARVESHLKMKQVRGSTAVRQP